MKKICFIHFIVFLQAKMARKVGRPVVLDHEKITKVVLDYQEQLTLDKKLISKNSPIWEDVGKEVGLSSTALYAFVANNKCQIKTQLLGKANNSSLISENSISHNDAVDSYEDMDQESEVNLYLSKKEFENLLETRTGKR